MVVGVLRFKTDAILRLLHISSENEEEATTRELEADRLAKLVDGIVSSGVNVFMCDNLLLFCGKMYKIYLRAFLRNL